MKLHPQILPETQHRHAKNEDVGTPDAFGYQGPAPFRRAELAALDRPIARRKAELANHAVRKHQVKTFADLGACWGVNAGYTLDILRRNSIDRAFAVDQFVTQLSRERGKAFPQLSFVQGLFNDRRFIENFEPVDALILFDVLLHQVNLDWDEVLAEWGKKARILIINNQNWTRDEHSVRFLDRGKEWFKRNVYFSNEEVLNGWFDKLDQVDPATGRLNRDKHGFWQWGITRNDLIRHLESIGFVMDFFEDYGPFSPRFPWILNQGFIFIRTRGS